ncbi:MAG TPA: hypothetical protein VNY84_00580 [Acidimicrobiales bacterium]|nr:hypothetical protein [Acidimicrobiales bacterium]
MDELEFNDQDLPLAELIDHAPTATAHPDALRAIVARGNRSRVRALAVALVAVAVAGPLAGYAVGHTGSPTTAVAAADRTSAAQPKAAGGPNTAAGSSAPSALGAAVPGDVGAAPSAKQVFLRDTADGVRIRAYVLDLPALKIASGCGTVLRPPAATGSSGPAILTPAPTSKAVIAPAPEVCTPPIAAPTCLPSALLEGEVSNDQVAGSSEAPVLPVTTGQAIDILNATVVGSGEPTPIGTVFVHTTPAVTKVVLTFKGGGSDEMAPTKDGYAVLAHGVAGLALAAPSKPNPPPAEATGAPTINIRSVGFGFPEATVTAFDKNGTQLASTNLPAFVSSPAPACVVNGGTASGTASSGTATGGSVSSGPATATGGSSVTSSGPATSTP